MRYFITVLILIAATGCVRTNLTSYSDPSLSSGYRLGKVMVFAGELPLDERAAVETKFVEQFASEKVQAVRGMDVLPPTRQFTQEEVGQVVQREGVDSVLMMVGYSKSTSSTYVPPTYYPGNTTGTVQYFGNTAYIQTYTQPGYTTGGYSIRKPVYAYKLNLHDARTGQIVWTASADARGSAFADAETFGYSTAATTITKLTEDGLLAR